MSASIQPLISTFEHDELQQLLDKQRQAALRDMPVSLETRLDRLDRAIDAVISHDREIADALHEDFGTRHQDLTRMVDSVASVNALRHARKRTRRWMKHVRRSANFPLNLLGAKAEIRYQPKGVVGLISPWNFPINLTFMPLAGILAAGNRCMIKPSEFTPATSALMARMIASAFDESEVAVVQGDADFARAFGSLPFDHLLFTGATSVGRHVMRAAAENLVPVTLELGGKSPAIIGRDADLKKAADRIVIGKLMNAGQVCLAPDYVLVHEAKQMQFVDEVKTAAEQMYPTIVDNQDYTSVINARHEQRLRNLLDEASTAGAEIVEVNPSNERFDSQVGNHKMPLSLVLSPGDDLKVMQDEIFGPILPIKPYANIAEAVAYVNAKPRPLGLYYFGHDKSEEQLVLERTLSGGVTINDVIQHVIQEDLPFGGIGPSGMGSYHGFEGFQEFSHARSVYRQSPLDVLGIAGLRPPYGKRLRQMSKRELGS